MEWIFGTVIAVMFGLYIWAKVTTGREVSRKVQPHIDRVFGTPPRGSDHTEKKE